MIVHKSHTQNLNSTGGATDWRRSPGPVRICHPATSVAPAGCQVQRLGE
ncbi:hypothetical protein OG905_19470 [Streptomyces sp. NBC_00322]|nr:hypothetical protein [Streptomyces sp. NBC_00322]